MESENRKRTILFVFSCVRCSFFSISTTSEEKTRHFPSFHLSIWNPNFIDPLFHFQLLLTTIHFLSQIILFLSPTLHLHYSRPWKVAIFFFDVLLSYDLQREGGKGNDDEKKKREMLYHFMNFEKEKERRTGKERGNIIF